MRTNAIVMEAPGQLMLTDVALADPGIADIVVETAHSGISTGTEKLLWEGRMPSFPGLGYPLVPGYEAVGRVVEAGVASGRCVGEIVFVPGSTAFRDIRGLFGASARHLIVPGTRAVVTDIAADPQGVLLALAATAHHALAGGVAPDLVIGHGTVGRLLARIAIARGDAAPTVWEKLPSRFDGASGYTVLDAAADERRDYRAIYDCSGDGAIVDIAMQRLARGGEIVLAGFYAAPVSFTFPPAFMREARLRIAAEWQPADMAAVLALIETGKLSLAGLVTDRAPATDAPAAYARAFAAPDCLKMILDWDAA